MQMFFKLSAVFSVVLLTCLLWGCRGVDSYDGRSDEMGEVTFAIADSPLDTADEVLIYVESLEFYPEDGSDPVIISIEDNLNPIDLMQFTGGASEQLFDRSRLPIDRYNQVKVIFSESDTPVISFEGDDSRYDLVTSASLEDELTIDYTFSVQEDSDLYFTIDIDLRLSISEDPMAPGTYLFSPQLRMVDTEDAATISGNVALDMFDFSSDCDDTNGELETGNAVYVFRETNNIQDIQGNSGDPIATATVNELTGAYVVPFLAPDTYTLAFTCDAELDIFSENNFSEMEFSDVETEELKKAEVKTVNFSN